MTSMFCTIRNGGNQSTPKWLWKPSFLSYCFTPGSENCLYSKLSQEAALRTKGPIFWSSTIVSPPSLHTFCDFWLNGERWSTETQKSGQWESGGGVAHSEIKMQKQGQEQAKNSPQASRTATEKVCEPLGIRSWTNRSEAVRVYKG